tara:strand:+ start:2353 stop:4104 length:1752 start_codon:yes stop_codon:yes gene_type:complete
MARIAVIHKEKCKPDSSGKFCIKACPVNRTGKECITMGTDGKVVIDEKLCIGCNICVKCPLEAISIINLPEELDKKPIHRFGVNGFSLYSLPVPVFNKVVGVLGVNGIGKSTAIKILAGMLKPNLGEQGKEASYRDLIEYFKGTEAQLFFEKVRDGKIKISYKPQQVDLIPSQFKGKVKELLKKVDEKNKLEEVAKQLDIEPILGSNIGEISGGELQRVAIAAAVLKKANIYIFDEITSYLDIKQRLNVSRFIRELADEDTAVMVIEHDLIALDYMTDLIHIMYGKEDCYGITSLPRTTKNGINAYLEGFLKEENIRFRSYKIMFESKAKERERKYFPLTNWQDIEKKLGSFELKADSGTVNKNEVVGVLGENGIGKTSFIKVLAGVVKPDKGTVDHKIKVSYKPQYIDTDSDELVLNVLKDAIKKYNSEVIAPLNIKPLFNKQINQLSGGELQRVAIALSLSKDCDLVLLDEPSAYLDVEQRLNVSKTIKNIIETRNISAIVVDHDLLFLDYLSDRLLVFNGVPAKQGIVEGPFSMEEGMNSILEILNLSLRRDELSHRPRINKVGSVKDREQKKKGKLYYS